MVPALKSQPEMVTAATVYEKLPKIFIGESGISIAAKEIASVICGLRREEKNCLFGALQSSQGQSSSSHIPDKFINQIFSESLNFFFFDGASSTCSFLSTQSSKGTYPQKEQKTSFLLQTEKSTHLRVR